MILLVGEKTRLSWIEEALPEIEEEEAYIAPKETVQINEILAQGSVRAVVYDIEQYTDEADKVAEAIQRIGKLNNAIPVIYAPGYLPQSTVIKALTERGVKTFIFPTILSEQKDHFLKCLNGYFAEFAFNDLPKPEEETVAPDGMQIGVAGSQSRIGTTTQAIQLCKYLLFKGYTAAYVELNDSLFIKGLKDWIAVKEGKGCIQYGSLELYYDLSVLPEIKKQYQYLVYDYGRYTGRDFNKLSFLEKDKKIFVCGASSSELDETVKLLKSDFYTDCEFIFSFVPEGDQKDIRKMIADGRRASFAPWTPDPFVYKGIDLYEDILPLKAKEKKRRFGRKVK